MAAKKTEAKSKTAWLVKSANTGATVVGPLANKLDAQREAKRLNREAATGMRADGGLINYEVIWRCGTCATLAERHPDHGFNRCPECHDDSKAPWEQGYELVETDRRPMPILHEGLPQKYEVVSDSGLVIPS